MKSVGYSDPSEFDDSGFEEDFQEDFDPTATYADEGSTQTDSAGFDKKINYFEETEYPDSFEGDDESEILWELEGFGDDMSEGDEGYEAEGEFYDEEMHKMERRMKAKEREQRLKEAGEKAKEKSSKEETEVSPSQTLEKQIIYDDGFETRHLNRNLPLTQRYFFEIILAMILAIYAVNFIMGKNENEKIAVNWTNINKPLFDQEFAYVGIGDGKEPAPLLE